MKPNVLDNYTKKSIHVNKTNQVIYDHTKCLENKFDLEGDKENKSFPNIYRVLWGGFRGGDLVTCHHLFFGHDFTH